MARPALYDAFLRERGLIAEFERWRKVRVTLARQVAGRQGAARRRTLEIEERIFGDLRR